MDVKAGATVGFITVLGGVGGAVVGTLVDALVSTPSREGGKVVVLSTALGALAGAFLAGTVMAPTPTTGTGAARPLLPPLSA